MSSFSSKVSRCLRIHSPRCDQLAHKTSTTRPLQSFTSQNSSNLRQYELEAPATTPQLLSGSPRVETERPGPAGELKITPEVVTAGKSLFEVFRGWAVFKTFDFKFIVDHNMKLYRFTKAILGQRLTDRLVRPTIFAQFAGGVDPEDTKKTVQRLANCGISSIWFYSLERDLE